MVWNNIFKVGGVSAGSRFAKHVDFEQEKVHYFLNLIPTQNYRSQTLQTCLCQMCEHTTWYLVYSCHAEPEASHTSILIANLSQYSN